jgi:hypothetical protein
VAGGGELNIQSYVTRPYLVMGGFGGGMTRNLRSVELIPWMLQVV